MVPRFGIFLFVLTLHVVLNNATKEPDADGAKKYLRRFGYMDKFTTNVEEALKRFQYFANLKMTGQLDKSTKVQMTLPRCGLQDPKIKVKTRRFIHQGSKWSKTKLTWRLVGRGRTLDRKTIRRVMYQAFRFWSDVTNLEFTEISGQNPDIWVKFVTYSHGDPYAFDGEGGTLAHAFYPHNNKGLSGDVHFDDHEPFTVGSTRGRNLLWVATHEIGHSIGLEHSNVREAVMYPWYTKYKPGFKLNYDDIIGIQSLYGSKRIKTTKSTTTATTPTTTTTTTTTRATTRPTTPKTRPVPDSQKCPQGKISAVYYNSYSKMNILLTNNGKLYFLNKNGGIRYGPVRLSNYLPKSRLKGSIDAAYNTRKINGKENTVFFVGNKYYVFQHFRYRSGPHSIHGNVPGEANPLNLKFPTWVSRINAVMTWHRNGRTYFFAGRHYWRYNNDNKQFDAGYPRVTQYAWRGLPKQIDAAYSSASDRKTFFISGNQYYLLNDKHVRVANNYPEHIGREWLDCGGVGSISNIGSVGASGISVDDDKWGLDP